MYGFPIGAGGNTGVWYPGAGYNDRPRYHNNDMANAGNTCTGYPSSKTYSFEGIGDYTQIFTMTSDGTWVFRMNYPGDEVFIVTIKDESGDDIGVLANEGGSYTGTKSVQLDAGTYYLDVAAATPWTITISTA
jgi:hypothetical protein